MTPLFLICALSMPSTHFPHFRIVPYHMVKTDIEKLQDFIHRNNPDAEIFIHPNPQRDKLREGGYERVPFRYKDQEIWIRRKPATDIRRGA